MATMEDVKVENEIDEEEESAEEIRKPENVVSLLQVDQLNWNLDMVSFPLADVNQGGICLIEWL